MILSSGNGHGHKCECWKCRPELLDSKIAQLQADKARLINELEATLHTLLGKGLPPNPIDASSMMAMVKHKCEKSIIALLAEMKGKQ